MPYTSKLEEQTLPIDKADDVLSRGRISAGHVVSMACCAVFKSAQKPDAEQTAKTIAEFADFSNFKL